MSRWIRRMGFAIVVSMPSLALADMAPRPWRPGWNDPPAPLPTPPELVVIVAVVLVAALIALARRRSVRSEEAPS